MLKIEEYLRVALNNCVLVKMAKFQVKKNISVMLRASQGSHVWLITGFLFSVNAVQFRVVWSCAVD